MKVLLSLPILAFAAGVLLKPDSPEAKEAVRLCRPCYQGAVDCGDEPELAHWHECAGDECLIMEGGYRGPYDANSCSGYNLMNPECDDVHTACGTFASALGFETPQALFNAIETMKADELSAVVETVDYVGLSEKDRSVLVFDCEGTHVLAERTLTRQEYEQVRSGSR